MPLIAVWKSNPAAVEEFSIEQVVSAAGDGNLRDSSLCAQEFRQYLAEIPSKKIAEYVDHCLQASFNKSGHVLQDLINETGRRLDYKVTNGLYQGSPNKIGFDGIWLSPEGHSIIVEVKTTDAYRISLQTIASYREKLIAQNHLTGPASILIIVGRDDTGELEAQIRGSRYAWDIRLISADALMKLVRLKENSEGTETASKIRSILAPMEFTRLDQMVDVMFTTAVDIEAASEEISSDTAEDNEAPESTQHRYYSYWYAYHPQWDDFLREGTQSYFILGGMDIPGAFAVPWKIIHSALPNLNTTKTERGMYWHIHVAEPRPSSYALLLPKISEQLPIDEYRIPFS